MPKFSYIARKTNGEKETGVIEGPVQDEVVAKLQTKGLLVTSIIPFDLAKKESSAHETKSHKKQFSHEKIKDNDLLLFARQLSMLLGAGVSLMRSLDVISKQVDSKRLCVVINQIRQDMESGKTLRDAIAKFPQVFSPLWINLVETGEASGNLPMVLDKLAYYLEESAAFKSKIVSALVYPAILLFVSVAALFFFVLKIVPTFAEIFNSFGVTLPLATRILIALSDFLAKKSIFMFGGVIAFIFIFKNLSRKPPFDKMIEEFKFKLPVFGDFLRFLLLEKFATTMSILIESGVPILYALEISERSSGSAKMSETIAFIKNAVKEGRSMADPMEKSDFFTPMIVQMVAIGEEIGELANMIKRIAKYYQEYLATFVTRLTAIFEPVMIVFVGLMVGSMVIALFLPIFSLSTMKGM